MVSGSRSAGTENDRYTAAAADYANIGLIELHQGNAEQARKNLQTAVACAETFGKTVFPDVK